MSSDLKAPVRAGLLSGIGLIIVIAVMMNPITTYFVAAPAPVPQDFTGPGSISESYVSAERLFFNVSFVVNNNSGVSGEPAIATNGQNIYTTSTNFLPDSDDPDIFFRRTLDGGKTFQEPVNISNTPEAFSSNHGVAASGKYVYVVWQDGEPEPWEIYIRVSDDYGATFGRPINLSNNTAFSAIPQIAASGSDVYVVWYDDPEQRNNFDIYLRISHDHGATFGDAINLSKNEKESYSPQIVVLEGNNSEDKKLYIAWHDYSFGNGDILLRASNDNGQTFDGIVNISNDALSSREYKIAVSDHTRNVYVVWQSSELPKDMYDASPQSVLFKASYDGGKTFGYAINLGTNVVNSFNPTVVAGSNDNVYVAWDGAIIGGYSDILFRKSDNGGMAFSRAYNLSNNPSYSRTANVIVEKAANDTDHDKIYMFWADNSPSFAISQDGGDTFSVDSVAPNSGIAKLAGRQENQTFYALTGHSGIWFINMSEPRLLYELV